MTVIMNRLWNWLLWKSSPASNQRTVWPKYWCFSPQFSCFDIAFQYFWWSNFSRMSHIQPRQHSEGVFGIQHKKIRPRQSPIRAHRESRGSWQLLECHIYRAKVLEAPMSSCSFCFVYSFLLCIMQSKMWAGPYNKYYVSNGSHMGCQLHIRYLSPLQPPAHMAPHLIWLYTA